MDISSMNDTICAPSTGAGAIGIIRISGIHTLDVIANLLKKNTQELPARKPVLCVVYDSMGNEIDQAIILIYKSPQSYTGENMAEIQCHGSPYILKTIPELLIKLGCRMAQPGEFTFRAYMNGKMDLTQAESVSDVISSTHKSAHKTAMNQMRGGYSKRLTTLRTSLIDFIALIELELDFGDEDVEFADRKKLLELISDIYNETYSLAKSFHLGNSIRNGFPVAIIGKPNAGKSTLLNSILGDEKAITSEIPGTTRDIVEDIINLQGAVFRLMDTAGIRNTTDTIEQEGVKRSLKKASEAGLVLYIFDVSTHDRELVISDINKLQLEPEIPVLKIGNKCDLENIYGEYEDTILISARNSINIQLVKEFMIRHHDNIFSTSDIDTVTNLRHYELLNNASQSLEIAKEMIQSSVWGELLIFELKEAAVNIGKITGSIGTEDILDSIFSRFCIGK